MDDIAIKVKNVSKTFRLPHEKNNSIKSAIVNFYRPRKKGYELQQALNGISFEVKKGEFFGIVGRNGSGKSTLLKLLAGIYTPTGGEVQVSGKLTPFIELGVGFNPELTGRENVYLNGALLGFNRKEMQDMYDDIVDFAELKKFMDQKLKNYSSGMQVRLAFSIAIKAETEILLIDEVLAVGDALFQQKCYDYFQQIKDSDKTVVFISHDQGAIENFCDRAILINDGKIIIDGLPEDVTSKYNELISGIENQQIKNDELEHHGIGGAHIIKGEVIDSNNNAIHKIVENEEFTIRIHYQTNKKIKNAVIGLGIMGQHGQSIIGPNTRESKIQIPELSKKGIIEARFPINVLSSGRYRVRASITNSSVSIPYDFVEELLIFNVIGKKRYGDVHIEPEWKIDDRA